MMDRGRFKISTENGIDSANSTVMNFQGEAKEGTDDSQ